MSAPFPNSANRFINPLLPDVKEGIYATDEFRMYRCKVEKCPYDGNLHNWKQCPYTHTDERARRRDPKKYSYKHTPCSNFTNMSCEYGDQCGNAHGDFERGLHPDFYRTESCLLGRSCTRPICFYAHTQELRKTSSSLSACSRKPAPCPVPDFPSTPVTLPKSPSTIEMSKNSPNNPLESSDEQNLPSQPSLSAVNSPSPEISTFSNVEDGFPGKKIRRYSDLFTPPCKSAATDQSQKQKQSIQSSSETNVSPTHINHSHPCLSESPSTTGISNNDPDKPFEGLSSKEQSLLPQPSLSESPSTILISDSTPDVPLGGSSSNEQSLSSQPSLSESPSTIAISNNAPDYTLEGLSSNEQSILSRPNLSADSPRPETSFYSNMEDGFPGKHYHTFCESRKQKQSMLSPSRTCFSPRNVNHSLSQPLTTIEPASPTNYQVSMPALQATQPQQTSSPSSNNLVFNSSAADNSDDHYETCYGLSPDLDWVDDLLNEPDE